MSPKKTPAAARLEVNPIACEAVGLCVHLAPDLVRLDRWGYPVMPEDLVPSNRLAAARRAVRGCPRRALGLVHESDH